MMSHYEKLVHDKFDIVKHNIKSDRTFKYAAILESLKSRLINIVNRGHAIELFDMDMLNFDELDHAKTVDDVTDIVDRYLEITDFYEKNYRTFSWLLRDEAIRNQLRHGDIHCWNEILLRRGMNYKRLSSEQSRSYLMDILLRTQHQEDRVPPVLNQAIENETKDENKQTLSPIGESAEVEVVQVDASPSEPPKITIAEVELPEAAVENTPSDLKCEQVEVPVKVEEKPSVEIVAAVVDAILEPTAIDQPSESLITPVNTVSKSQINVDEPQSDIARAPSQLLKRSSIEQPVFLDLRKREFQNKLVDLVNDFYGFINDTNYWQQQMGPLCPGSKVKIMKDHKQKKAKIPHGIMALRETLPTIGNIFSTSEENQLNQALRCLSVMIESVPKHKNGFCLFSHHGVETKFYQLIHSMKKVYQDDLTYKDKIQFLDVVRERFQYFFTADEKQSPRAAMQ